MKKLIFTPLCILLLSKTFAQTDKPSSAAAFNHKAVEIELSSPGKTETQLPRFSHFEVVDARPDTTYIGVHTETLWVPGTRMRQLVLKGSVTRALPDFLNNHFTDPEAPYKVLVIIRKLWVSDVTYSYREEEQKDEVKLGDSKINCRLRAEIYVSANTETPDDSSHYTPVLRYDSLLQLDKTGYNRVGNSLSDLLQDLADSLSGLNLQKKWEAGRRLTRTDISRFSGSLFDYPIFRDSALVKGVYANFDEFRNNAPSIREYEIGMEKKRSVLYTKDPSGTAYYNHSAWGICDGKNLYVMLEGYIFPIFREQNAFYLTGFVETKANQEDLKEERNEYAAQLRNAKQSEQAAGLQKAYGIPKAGGVQSYGGYSPATLATLDYNIKYNKNALKRQTRVFAIDPDTGAIY